MSFPICLYFTFCSVTVTSCCADGHIHKLLFFFLYIYRMQIFSNVSFVIFITSYVIIEISLYADENFVIFLFFPYKYCMTQLAIIHSTNTLYSKGMHTLPPDKGSSIKDVRPNPPPVQHRPFGRHPPPSSRTSGPYRA